MTRSRLNHEVDAPLEIINGWQFYCNEELFIRTGPGHYEYNFKTRQFTFNGKPLELFPIIKVVAEWYEADQAQHRIDCNKIETAVLKIDLLRTTNSTIDRSPLLKRLLLRTSRYFNANTDYRISTEMIIKTGKKTFSKRSGRGFSLGWITKSSQEWKIDRADAKLVLINGGLLVLALLGLLLVKVSTLFVLFAAPFSILTSRCLFNWLSHILFHKEFNPPSKRDSSTDAATRKWSDWLLTVPYLFLAVYGVFCFGEIADLIRHEDAWHF